jgi:hypothetical protein
VVLRQIYVLGPLLPPRYGIETQNGEEGASVDVEMFLGEMQVQHGKRSVFFASLSFPFSSAFQLNNISDFFWHYVLFPSFRIR